MISMETVFNYLFEIRLILQLKFGDSPIVVSGNIYLNITVFTIL